jgi:ubiquinone/menaquinone biosynthesis C-methylase UbiE
MTTDTAGTRYEGIAHFYDKRRPSYPVDSVRAAASLATEAASSGSVLDIGCGTGIFTRLLAAELPETFSLTGIEPSDDMRATAAARSESDPRFRFITGRAEALPVDTQSAVLVTAATAAHWFDRPKFYVEAARVLKPGGSIALLQNERRWWDNQALAEYEAILESLLPDYRRGMHPDAHDHYSVSNFANELSSNDLFVAPVVTTWNWEMGFERHAFIEFSQSSTIVQRAIARTTRDVYCRTLEDLLDRHSKNDLFTVHYQTRLVAASAR